MRSKRMVIVLVAGVAGVVAFAAANAIGSSGLVAPVATNSAGEPVIKSPNGQFSITVGNAGIVLRGPSETVVLSSTALRATVTNLDLRASSDASMAASGKIAFRAQSSLDLTGTQVELNGCAQPVVRGTDTVVISGSTGRLVPGQQAVCMG